VTGTKSFAPRDYLDLSKIRFPDLFPADQPAWTALGRLKAFFAEHARSEIRGRVSPQASISGEVFIDEGTVVEPGAVIKGPAMIGKNCEIRTGAYLRGQVLVGDSCVLGNSCEFKNAILFDEATVPHFSYVGDSIVGFHAHLGAGVILSNVKLIPGNVEVVTEKERIDTGLRKFGGLVGDRAEIGCGCILNPGSVIGPRALLYPNLSWRGVCPADSVVKLKQEFQVTSKRTAPSAKS